MTHKVSWLKENRVLLAEYLGHQDEKTLKACMDEMVEALDTCETPIAVLIDWRGVTDCEMKALLNMRGHRVYSHPMAARGVLVGMDILARFENEISAVRTRNAKNTQYFETMEEAMVYLEDMLTPSPMPVSSRT